MKARGRNRQGRDFFKGCRSRGELEAGSQLGGTLGMVQVRGNRMKHNIQELTCQHQIPNHADTVPPPLLSNDPSIEHR